MWPLTFVFWVTTGLICFCPPPPKKETSTYTFKTKDQKKLNATIWGRLGLLGLTRIAPNPKIDFRNPFFAIIDFESQFLGSVNPSQSEQSERLGLQYWTLKVKNCNPSNPSRVFQFEQSESIIDFFFRPQI